jgi:uncharacterized protein (TIGR00297 family)
MQLIVGVILAILIAIIAWRVGSLNASGAVAAVLTGGLVFGLGGIAWAALLLTFFVTSSIFSKAFSRHKSYLSEKFAKGSQRDAGQVLANGGLGALLALAHSFFPGAGWLWFGFIGAMAAVNADTWATELGVLNPSRPRLVTTGQTVEPGTSGGVSLLGTAAAIGGAALVGAIAALITPVAGVIVVSGFMITLLAALVGGVVGAMFDSLLGATVQSIYFCSNCQKETERYPLHTCGTQTVRKRGLSWLNNDAVNFACSLSGALVSVGIWFLAG